MEVVFTSEQIRFVLGLLSNLGFLSLATAVIPFIIPQFKPERSHSIILGLLLTMLFWLLGMVVAKKIQED